MVVLINYPMVVLIKYPMVVLVNYPMVVMIKYPMDKLTNKVTITCGNAFDESRAGLKTGGP